MRLYFETLGLVLITLLIPLILGYLVLNSNNLQLGIETYILTLY